MGINWDWYLFNEDDDEPFVIKHCFHPGNRKKDGKKIVRNQIEEALYGDIKSV